MEQKKIKEFYKIINQDMKIADKDSDKATDSNDESYYIGFYDGLHTAKRIVTGLNRHER